LSVSTRDEGERLQEKYARWSEAVIGGVPGGWAMDHTAGGRPETSALINTRRHRYPLQHMILSGNVSLASLRTLVLAVVVVVVVTNAPRGV
jgi:hypothetical protein